MEKLNSAKGAPPLYLQISEILRNKILTKEYAFDTIIPSETELQGMYQVSRITARQAIQELEKDGLVSRARGKGTVVIYQKHIEEFLTRIRSFTDEMKELGIVPGTSYAHMELVKADQHLAKVFQVEPDVPLYRLERVRTGDGKPIVIFQTYFHMGRNLPLDDSMYYGSLYAMLEEMNIHPVRIKEKFDCIMPDAHTRELLKVQRTIPILRRIRTSYDESGEVVEYTVSLYRGDRYSYSVEIRK